MANGAALIGGFVLLVACGSRTELDARGLDVSPESTAGGASAGGASASAGTHATAGSSSTGGGGVPPRCTLDVISQPGQMFPASSFPPGPIDAVVLAVSDTNIQLVTAQGDASFGWVGPSLVARLAPGEIVELSMPPAWLQDSAPYWNLLTSKSVTLATLHTSLFLGWPSETPEKVVTFVTTRDLPYFEFVDASCCRLQDEIACEYRTLTAAVGGQTVRIQRGDTGSVGPWQVTNFGAIYAKGLFSFGLTALGPATLRP
jgi:hypothetical protein